MTANDLAERVQTGETEFFAEIYEIFAQKIYSFIFYKTFHRETAEDLTSQTFTKALEKINSFNPEKGSLNSWLYAIARNAVIDHFRTYKKMQNVDDIFDLESPTDIPNEFDSREGFAEIRDALQKISPQQREIILLRVWDGMKFREIAEILEKSEAAVKMDFARGIKNLKKEVVIMLLLFSINF